MIDWAGQFGATGNVDDVGQAARFNNLGHITGDGTYIYVTSSNTVKRIEIATASVSTFVGSGSAGYNDDVGTAAQFNGAEGLATDGQTLWVADSLNYLIRAVDLATGAVRRLAGVPGMQGAADGLYPVGALDSPRAITYNGQYLFVADSGIHAIRRVDPVSGEITTLAGNNGAGAANGNVAQFSAPRNLHAYGTDLLYVGDSENHLVREVALPSGLVSSPLGSTAGHADGFGTAAMFRRLRGITDDGTALIVADSDNYVLRKVELPSYQVTTIAGTPGNNAHAEGLGAAAGFDKPMDVHYDPVTGDLFITESNVVRRMYYQ